MQSISRRRLLRGLCAVGLTGVVAGCSNDTEDEDDEDEETESGDDDDIDGGEGATSTPPKVSFMFEYQEQTDSYGTLTITHDGGYLVNAERLAVRGTRGSYSDGGPVDETWVAIADGALPGGRGTITGDPEGTPEIAAGDYLQFEVGADSDLRVVWTRDDDQGDTLGTWEGPDA